MLNGRKKIIRYVVMVIKSVRGNKNFPLSEFAYSRLHCHHELQLSAVTFMS